MSNTAKEGKSDAAIVRAIRKGGKARVTALAELFTRRRWELKAREVLLAKGGRLEELPDLFQNAFLIFDQSVRTGKFRGDGSLEHYFLGIFKHNWATDRRSDRSRTKVETGYVGQVVDQGKPVRTPEDQLLGKDQSAFIKEYLNKLGATCKKAILLRAEGFKMKEIAKELGYTNTQSAKNTLQDCREKFRTKLGDQFLSILQAK